MHYFITEQERRTRKLGSCFFEFQRGAYRQECWLEDSLLLDADLFDSMKLYELFRKALPEFAYYGLTTVTQEQWEKLCRAADAHSSQAAALIAELTPWAEDCFRSDGLFTICGI